MRDAYTRPRRDRTRTRLVTCYIAARLMGDPDSECECLAASSVADERDGPAGGWRQPGIVE